MTTSEISSHSPDPWNHKAKALSWTAASILTISLVALATLFLCQHFELFQASAIVLYAPPGSVGGLGTLLGIVSLKMRRSEPKSVPHLESLPKSSPDEEPVEKPKTPRNLKSILSKTSLHPPIPSPFGEFLFPEPALHSLDNASFATSCFLLMTTDFMALDLDRWPRNESLSLSFLIQRFKELGENHWINTQKLDALIHELEITHAFASWITTLSTASTPETYHSGRQELKKRMLLTLKGHGSILLSSGFAGRPAGHIITIKLMLEKDRVSGVVVNRGEGSHYHGSSVGEKEKVYPLHLNPIPLEELESSHFLETLIDLQMSNLVPSEARETRDRSTNYQIQDVYEVLLPLWPAAQSTDVQERPASQQHGPTCSMETFLPSIREILGEKEAKIAKIYLSMKAFELLVEQVDLQSVDLNRIKDALAKLNRDAVELDRQSLLPPKLKEGLLAFLQVIELMIARVEVERANLKKQITLPPLQDRRDYSISLPKGQLVLEASPSQSKPVALSELPRFLGDTSGYLTTVVHTIDLLTKEKQLTKAKQIAHEALLAVPNPTDSFWGSSSCEQDMRMLSRLLLTLLKGASHQRGPLVTTPNEAILYLKVICISLQHSEKNSELEEISNLYGGQTQWMIEKFGYLYRLTHPEYANLFSDCRRVLNRFRRQEKKLHIQKGWEGNSGYNLENHPYKAMSEARRDPELRFLHASAQVHKSLFGVLKGVINKDFTPLKNTLGLYKHEPFGEFLLNVALHPEPMKQPELAAIRQWVHLRDAYYFFLFASYLVGEVKPRLGDNNQPRGFGLKFSRYQFKSEHPALRQIVHVDSFQLESLDSPSRGLFLNTFQQLEKTIHPWLTALLDRTVMLDGKSKTTQNAQLLFQQMVKFGENFNLSALEQQELLSILTYDELMIPQLIAYFTRHFNQIHDPRFQALFSFFLFSLNSSGNRLILQEVMKSPSRVKHQLFSFLKGALNKTEALKWIDAHLFFLRLLAQSNRFLAESGHKNDLLDNTTRLLKKKVERLFRTENDDPAELGNIFYTIISLLPYLDYAGAEKIIKLCEEAKKISLENGLAPKKIKDLQMKSDLKRANLLIQTGVESKEMLPKWILEHDDYIFDRNFRTQKIGPGLYSFRDEKGREYRLKTEGGAIFIYQKFEDDWYEHKTTSPFIGDGFPSEKHPCVDGILVKGTRVWFRADPQSPPRAIVMRAETTVCSVTPGGVLHPTENLRLAKSYDAPLIKLLERIAPKNEILAWKDAKNQIVKVEIPKHQLTLDLRNGKWVSLQHLGYFLESDQHVPTLFPYSHYLVFSNRGGKRIVVIPSFDVTPSQQKGFLFSESTLLESDLTNLHTYRLNKRREIKPPSLPEPLVYLSYLALRNHDYCWAKQLLKKLKREQPDFDVRCCQWIQYLDKKSLKDRHPQALSLRIQFRLLMLKLSSISLNDHQKKGLKQDYFRYLKLYKHTFGFRLSASEDQMCITLLRKMSLDEQELFILAVHTGQPPQQHNKDVEKEAYSRNPPQLYFSWIDATTEVEMWHHLTSPVPVLFNLRPGKAMVLNFLYYYSIARYLDPTHHLHQELQSMLKFTQFTYADVVTFSLRTVLVNVLENPKGFPTIEELKEKKLAETLAALPNLQVESKKKIPSRAIIRVPKPPLEASKAPSTILMPMEPLGRKYQRFDRYLLELGYLVQQKADRSEDLKALGEMETFFTGCKDDNPCIVREFERLVEGIQEKRKATQAETTTYHLNSQKMDALGHYLEALHAGHSEAIKAKREEVLALAHNYPPELLIEKHGGMLQPLTMQEMIVQFGINNDQAFYEANPSLKPADVAKLKKLISGYLLLSTDMQQVIQMAQALLQVQNAPSLVEKKAESRAFVQTALARHAYDPEKEPHLLVFEFFAKHRIRAEQYEALHELAESGECIDFEARTGFGKSTNLIPLWLLLTSQKKQCAMMAVPGGLFHAQHAHLRKILGKGFGALVVPILFNRSKANDPKYIARINVRIEEAVSEGKIVLTTIQSLHGMTSLKLKESLATGNSSTQTEIQKELLVLRKQIGSKVSCFFDESKESFDLRRRYDYAVGSLSSASGHQTHVAIELYREVLVRAPWNFEFLPQWKKQSPPLKEEYERKMLPMLAGQALCLLHVPERYRSVVLQDLQGRYTLGCEEFYQTLSPQNLEKYNLAKEHLTVHFRRTLFRKFRDRYGFLPGTRLAIPFLDGAKKVQSEFSSLNDSIDFTIQANLREPFTLSDIQNFFDKLKIESLETDPVEFEESLKFRFWQKIQKDFPNLMELKEEHFLKILEMINKDLLLKLDFIEVAVLPELKYYKQKVTSTSFNLIRSLHHLQAASGTVNPDSLPPRMRSHENRSAVVGNLLGMWKHSQERIFTLPSGLPSDKLSSFLKQRPEVNMIIDVAGTWRDFDLVETAQAIFKATKLKGVLLFDDEGKEFVLERGVSEPIFREESVLETQELFIFIRKSKAIGTHVKKVPLSAKGIITVDLDTPKDFFFQGAGRMRKLLEGHVVGFALEKEDESIIFSRGRNLGNLIAYTIRVQGLQKGEDASYALTLYLEELLDAVFAKQLDRCQTVQEVQALFKALEQFLVKETQSKNLANLRKQRVMLPAREAVKQLKTDYLAHIKSFPEYARFFNLNEIETAFDNYADLEKLPTQISRFSAEEEISTVEVDVTQEVVDETMTEQITEVELENENLSDQINELPVVNFRPAKPVEWNGDYASLCRGSPDQILLGIPVYFSPNFARVSSDAEENKCIQKPAYQYLVYHDGAQETKMVLLDLHDTSIVLKKMGVKPASDQGGHFLFSGRHMIAYEGNRSSFSSTPPIQLLRKLYIADGRLTKEEKEYLASMPNEMKKPFYAEIERLSKIWPHLSSFMDAIATATSKQKSKIYTPPSP